MKLSLGRKMTLWLVAFALVLSGVAMFLGYRAIETMNNTHYLRKADELAATIARVLNAGDLAVLREGALEVYGATESKVLSDQWGSPEFNAYVGRYDALAKTPEYQRVLAQLRSLQEVNDVNCLYASIVLPEDRRVMYLVDADTGEPCPIGCLDPLYEVNYRVASDPTVGFPAYITNTAEYGWLVSAGAPVYGPAGDVVAYAFADVSMDAIKAQENSYFLRLALALAGVTVVLCLITAFLVRHFVTNPLKQLSVAAERYCSPEERHRESFEKLDIHTHDEIEDLQHSMIRMEHDIDSFIDHLVETRAQLRVTRMEADLMNELAHKDALTGLRNRLAYDQEVLVLEAEMEAGETSFGIAVVDLNDLKRTNDTYGHESGNASLTKLSATICDTFKHSPVFRIGGDEFAVVLRGSDYERVDELVAQFNARLQGLREDASDDVRPWERISAAIGFARYDAALDSNVGSVFRRADAQMYEHKKRMKGERGVR